MPKTLPLFPPYMLPLFDWKLRTQSERIQKYILQSIACHLKKKSKSSQVNIMILYFYLLELSNYKQNKTKQKIDEEVCPQIEKKVQKPSSQLSWNFTRVQYGAYKSSYVGNTSTSTKYPNFFFLKKSTLFLRVENKSFDRYYIIELIR